ncbi:acyl-CoA dehydrogenase [Planomonospora sphaerica]|uniref:Acyl-CoA dehydrogenase n=1 Tax=Planomonospora sphaerica TaxID=161355 RepID=A0A161LI57_9ACTN|nr:acyl-CoA carboxylase subunit epsilon [Planomonospora sphaerica]GAT65097.1 acyl-CoA dehydrogenase [Planomonospora sphaerica]
MTHLKIVQGDATPEEVAALVLALTSRSISSEKVTRKSENWRNPAHRMRKPLPVGQGAWRSSGLPR